MEPQSNPYAPPKSQHLELPPEAGAGPSRHVEWACKLMWIGLGLSTLEAILTTLFSLGSDHLIAEIVGTVIGLAIALALVYCFTVKLRDGRNWMRWLVTILTVIGVVLTAFAAKVIPSSVIDVIFGDSPLTLVNFGLQMVLSVTEAVLINTPASRRWFREQSNRLP